MAHVHIGKRIYLDWSKELGAWCGAKVLAYKPSTRQNEVQYDDGEREWMDLMTPSRKWTEYVPKKVRKCEPKKARQLAREYKVKLGMSNTLLAVADELLDMEDRLPHKGVRSQLPLFWKNLRIQILRCKTPKDMTAAAVKFVGQIRETAVLEGWEKKAVEWTAKIQHASSEADVAALVQQVKFEMVDWARCRQLFPSLQPETPKPKVQKAVPAVKKEEKKANGTAAASKPPANTVAVECNGQSGAYQPKDHLVVCLCPTCHGQQDAMTPSAWEKHCGSRARNWRNSIRLKDLPGKLSSWLTARRSSDPSLAFHQMSPAEKAQDASPKGGPKVLPKKVSKVPPRSVARLRAECRSEVGQLSPVQKAQPAKAAGKRKREEEEPAKRASQDEETVRTMVAKRGKQQTSLRRGEEDEQDERLEEARPAEEERAKEERATEEREQEMAREEEAKEEKARAARLKALLGLQEDEEAAAELQCCVCKESTQSEDILVCDGEGCGQPYHFFCATPALKAVPEGDWFCARCQQARKANANEAEARSSSPGNDHFVGGQTVFQDFFKAGPANNPLFQDTEPQDDVAVSQLESAMASQPAAPSLAFDDMEDEFLAFTVPGSAYAC